MLGHHPTREASPLRKAFYVREHAPPGRWPKRRRNIGVQTRVGGVWLVERCERFGSTSTGISMC